MYTVTIAIATIFQNGGDATRAIEIAKAIQQYKPEDCNLKIVFLTRGSQFEQNVLDLGFELYHTTPKMKGIRYQDDFDTKFGELIGNEKLAYDVLQGEKEAYMAIKPDLLIHGFWPIGSIAKRMVIPNVKNIAFLPIPLKKAFLDEAHTFPDELAPSRLPIGIQHWIFRHIPRKVAEGNQALRHSCIRKAAEQSGWKDQELTNIFEMLVSDLYLVNDLPQFYHAENYGNNCIFTGPIYAQSRQMAIEDKEILKILDKSNIKKKIFCTLGSSGNKKALLEMVKMFNTPEGLQYSGIILSPPSVCPVEEARQLLRNKSVYVTDAFVPAKTIDRQVDLVICHGGQGTLQTAIASAVPLIGVATQPEQKINLEHLESFGSAIRISMSAWHYKHILSNVKDIFRNYQDFAKKAQELKQLYDATDAREIIGKAIWKELQSR
jgi:hypothetical protein